MDMNRRKTEQKREGELLLESAVFIIHLLTWACADLHLMLVEGKQRCSSDILEHAVPGGGVVS